MENVKYIQKKMALRIGGADPFLSAILLYPFIFVSITFYKLHIKTKNYPAFFFNVV